MALLYFGVAKVVNKVSLKNAAQYKSQEPEYNFWSPNWFGISAGILFALFAFFNLFIVNVGPQEVAVVKTPSGVKPTPLTVGWNLVWPWWDTYAMDKTVWVYTFSNKKTEGQVSGEDAIWAPTSEGIKMGFDMSVSWRIDPKYAPWIYQNVSEADGGEDGRYKWIENNIIRAKTKSIFALTCSKFTPIECYSTGRVKIQAEVESSLRKELEKLHLILDQVDIREVFYDKDYETEIKNKKVQEQKYLTLIEVTKQQNELLLQATIKKDIAIQTAEGEAKALQIKGNSISNNPKIIQLQWIEKWDGALPTYMMGSGQGIMLNLEK